jgi:hypothetical protein
MNKTIKFSTGRVYDAPQVLDITVEQESADEFGIIYFTAVFVDASRHISGRVETVAFKDSEIGKAVLQAYDAGQYQAV